jgi:magnesium chelatase family protein
VLAVRSLLGVTAAELATEGVPPFVAPHHSATPAAIIGGGSSMVRPGLITQAHHGVLFLDEAPEFRVSALQSLRQPLESGQVVVSRAQASVQFPARFQLVMAANPCPCGLGFGKGVGCHCSAMAKRGYLGRLSGPLLDRVDLQVQVPAVTRSSLAGHPGESSAEVASRVSAARQAQAERWAETPWRLNSQVPGVRLRRGRWRLPPSVTADLDRALDRAQLTLRGYDRVLRVGWTVADLAGSSAPARDDLGMALTLRNQGPVAA